MHYSHPRTNIENNKYCLCSYTTFFLLLRTLLIHFPMSWRRPQIQFSFLKYIRAKTNILCGTTQTHNIIALSPELFINIWIFKPNSFFLVSFLGKRVCICVCLFRKKHRYCRFVSSDLMQKYLAIFFKQECFLQIKVVYFLMTHEELFAYVRKIRKTFEMNKN